MSITNSLTGQILNFLFKHRAFAWRQNTVGIYDMKRGIYRTSPKKGVSDILCCYGGRFVAIEVKTGKDRLRPEQEGFLSSVRTTGGIALVVSTFDDFQKQWSTHFPNDMV